MTNPQLATTWDGKKGSRPICDDVDHGGCSGYSVALKKEPL